MVTRFVDALRKCFKAGGFAKRKDEAEEGGRFLVGAGGALFHIGDDYQVGRHTEGFGSVGCGENYALGSLWTTRQFDMTPRERVREALKAAAEYSAYVRGPFKIIEGGRK